MNKPDPQILTIFGASGDLAKRKLVCAVYELFKSRLLPENFAVLGASRTEFSDESFRNFQRENIKKYGKDKNVNESLLDEFLKHIYYQSLNTSDCKEYQKLAAKIESLQKENSLHDKIVFDCATPPNLYEIIPTCLKENGLNKPKSKDGWRRIIIEKPFGINLESAKLLNSHLLSIFDEEGIYRIDHYLGKETVQNILVLRFSNGIFEPLWNRNYIDFIEICVSETLGIENRGPYYEHAGAMRDMVQNHMMQLMAFVAMEAPANFDPESIRDEISKVIKCVRPMSEEDIKNSVVRGQYAAGQIDGQAAKAYVEEKDVARDSQTETYLAMKLFIDNWRWNGVPIYFSTGKALSQKKSEIVVHFKETPQKLFTSKCSNDFCNKLVIRIQPDESISVMFGLKTPGAGFEVRQVSMDFKYSSLDKVKLPDAYERLLLDAMLGDSTLYARNDALQASWKFIDPIRKYWQDFPNESRLHLYPAGSDGPLDGLKLLKTAEKENVCRLDPNI